MSTRIQQVILRITMLHFFCVAVIGHGYSQCSLSAATPIPDNSTVTLQFGVSGLIDNNLSSPTQGICGVEINFMHENIVDLTVTLVSPSGTSVTLIGPAILTTLTTSLSNWDIDFVPCGTMASPDPGFTDAWSNLQAWQILTPYSGTYHPQSGCLEDFNTGPANGIWQLIVQDHSQFQLGSIASATLIFCDPAGLNCSECNPNAGTLSPGNFNICSGENIQSSDINIDFGGNTPSPALYGYEYLLISGNTILQNGTSFSFTPPVGMYSICGLSYLLSDAPTIDGLIAGQDYALLAQSLSDGLACGQLTTSCIQVDVNAKPDTMYVSGQICNGEVFSFGGQNYFTDGLFIQIHDGPGLCDTVYEIRISPRSLIVDVAIPDTLSCAVGAVSIDASTTGASGPFGYSWSTITGNIISPANNSSIQVDQAGQYFLSVTDGVCDGSGSAFVYGDQGFPQVFFEGGTITCTQPVIDLHPIYIPTDGIIMWEGPFGFTSIQPNISVTVPGTYILHVTNQAGCTTSRSVDIGIDTTTFPIDIITLGKDCQNSQLTLGNTFPERLVAWNWTGPNLFTSNYWRPVVTDPGLYTLTGTFANGCVRSGSFLFDGDFTLPDISVPAEDTLNCNEIIALTATSLTAGVTYAWTGPQGLYSAMQTIQINQEGNYTAMITAPNGCQNTAQVAIVQGDDIFDFQVVSDTLTCSRTFVTIGVVSADADIFQWVNFPGPDADQPMIEVTGGGVYTVMMTDTNTMCVVTVEVFVHSDYSLPSFGYINDTITCNHPTATLSFVPYAGFNYTNVYWELPDLTTVPGPVLMSSMVGEHHLVAVNSNGCSNTVAVLIPFDTIVPFVILETDTLYCLDTVSISAQSLDSITTYQWVGPGIISFNDAIIDVDEPGWYHLSAFGLNGCPAELDIFVDSNFVAPSYLLMADSLRCDRPALLTADPSDPVLRYAWFDAANQLISSDSFVNVNQAGQYTFQIQGTNNCIAYDTVDLTPLRFPMITLSSDTFTCSKVSAGISALVDVTPYTIAWLDFAGDTFSITSSTNVMTPGPFVASVTGQNACTTLDTIIVPYDTMPPMAVISQSGDVRCQMRDFVLDGSASTPSDLLYSWTTSGGSLVSNPSLAMVDARDTGIYYLHVVRLDNGCSSTDSLLVQEHPDAITQAFVDVTSPECSGDDNASILVTGLSGGIAPLTYQLDGGSIQANPLFDGLDAGTYLLTVSDAENCVFDTMVIIEPAASFMVDAGPDVEIFLGESIQLSGMTDLLMTDILTDYWDSLGITLCTDCPGFEVSPLETATYTFSVSSITGCVKSDDVIVYVKEKGKYYIANVFSPNGDGINDEIRINASPGIARVVQWVIFDRWGNAVFGHTDFDPADPFVFWDGRTTTGEYANPAVFPYMLEIQLINGKHEVYNGNITLLR